MADARARLGRLGRAAAAVFSGMGGEGRLEYPIGRPLYTARSIRCPRVSKDGRHVAFLEDRSGAGIGGRVGIVDLEGRFTALTEDYRNARGLAWSADGNEVWFTAGGWRANRALHAVSLGGRAATSSRRRVPDPLGHRVRRAGPPQPRGGSAGSWAAAGSGRQRPLVPRQLGAGQPVSRRALDPDGRPVRLLPARHRRRARLSRTSASRKRTEN